MELSVLVPSVVGVAGSLVLLVWGVRTVLAGRKHSHVAKPVEVKPIAPVKPVEKKELSLAEKLLEMGRQHEEWKKGET